MVLVEAGLVSRLVFASAINWGDAPTWVGAIGALVVFVLAFASWRGDVQTRHTEREEARRAHANLITAWVDEVKNTEVTDARDYTIDADTETCAAVVIANRSDRTISEVHWTLWDQETECHMDSGYVRFLPPQREEVVFVPGPGGGDPLVHLDFIDANGLCWFRTDRVYSVLELIAHPDYDKWRDPENTWERNWPPDLVRRLRAEYRDHRVVSYDDEDIRLAVYTSFAATGRAPTVHRLIGEFGGPYREMRRCLRRLADARHLVIHSDETILMAPPFSALPMGFSVMGSRTLWWGGGAWHSFALVHIIPDERRVLISTQCHGCGLPQAHLVGRDSPPAGDQIAHLLVPFHRMWDDMIHTCRNQRLFCDEDCLQDWLESEGYERGYVLDLSTLWRLARDWHDGHLERGYTHRTPDETAAYLANVGLEGPFWGLANDQDRQPPSTTSPS